MVQYELSRADLQKAKKRLLDDGWNYMFATMCDNETTEYGLLFIKTIGGKNLRFWLNKDTIDQVPLLTPNQEAQYPYVVRVKFSRIAIPDEIVCTTMKEGEDVKKAYSNHMFVRWVSIREEPPKYGKEKTYQAWKKDYKGGQ